MGDLIVIGVPLIILLGWIWTLRLYTKLRALPTFDEYRRRYPQSVSGGVRCNKCNGSNIYLWWFFGPSYGVGPKKHICRACGSDLYRS